MVAFFGDTEADLYHNAHKEYAKIEGEKQIKFVHLDDPQCLEAHGGGEQPAIVFFRTFEEHGEHYQGGATRDEL